MLVSAADATEAVRLRLKWLHQFQFAGYYAARARGYYAEEGLDVVIIEGRADRSPIVAVLADEAEFGVSDADVALARLQGKPVVACASIFQHSPYILMSRRDRGIRRPADLAGAKVMQTDDQGAAQLRAMLAREGIPAESVNIVPHSWRLDDLIEGKVDAMSAYATVQPDLMRARGVEPAMMRMIDYGVDFYGDTLFTTEAEIAAHPKRVDAFVRASLRGWDYALRHPEETTELVLAQPGVVERGVTRAALLAEAEAMRPFILPDVVEIGHMNPGRWRNIAGTFTSLGMAPRADASFEGFLHEPVHASPLVSPRAIVLGGGVLLLSGLVVLWNVQMRRRVRLRTRELREEVTRRAAIEAELRRSEERFRMMFTGAATGIATTTPEGVFLQANPAYCATSERTEEELRGMNAIDLIHPDDQAEFQSRFAGLIEGAADHFVIETRCRRRSGGYVWKRASVSVVRTPEGRPASVVAVTEDITERIETAEKLRQSENRFRYVARATADVIWDWDAGTGMLWWSDGMAKLSGRAGVASPAGIDSWADNIHPDDRERVARGFHAFIAGRGETWHADYRFLRKDGTHVFVLDRAFAIRDAEGRAIRAVGGITDLTARRQAEEAAAANAELLRLASRIGGMGAWEIELPSGRLTWSEEVYRIHEVESDYRPELATALDFFPGESRRALEAAIARGESHDLELEFVTAKGNRRWVRTTSTTERASGELKRIYGVFQDITERRLAAEQLKATAAQYRLLFHNNPHPMWVYEGGTLRFLAVNAAAVAHYGYDEAEFLAMTIRDIRPAEQLAALDQAIAGLAAGEKVSGVWLHRKKNGEAIEVEITSDSIVFDGRPARLTLAHDVTERRRVDERVREQAALLDKAQDAILVRDLEHRITYWNKSAERLYGWTTEEATGRSVEALLYRDTTAFREAMSQLVARGEWIGELHQFDKEGRPLIIEGRWTLVRDDRGTPRGVLAINTDITEKKKLELQFLRAQRMESIGTLAGGIAHDLNNVLAPIILAIDLLKLSVADPRGQSMLATMASSAKRGADMVGQVLSFARGMEGRRVEVRPENLIRDIDKIALDAFPKNIRIEKQIAPDLWTVAGDPTQLHQVLLNLCVNARDAMPEGGRLVISAQNQRLDAHHAAMNLDAEAGPYVVLQVEDSGTGIPHALLDKIFDPFFTTKAVGQGTGLGLSTSLAIVKSHEGFIRVYSEPGQGTRFHVYLPAGAVGTVPPLLPSQSDLPRGAGELVLVVDDEASIRQIARDTLEAFGYRVLTACDGAEALVRYAERRAEIAVVITDMMMPVMDGPATILALLKVDPRVRIIAASGITAHGNSAKLGGLGVRHFISKPYTADALLKLLRRILAEEPRPDR